MRRCDGRRALRSATAALLLAAAALLQGALAAGATDRHRPSAERQRELFHLLKQDCGSCHGMLMKGGLGPALSAARLAPYSDQQLAATIRHGRPGTPMPPFGPLLSEADIDWLVATLRSGRAER